MAYESVNERAGSVAHGATGPDVAEFERRLVGRWPPRGATGPTPPVFGPTVPIRDGSGLRCRECGMERGLGHLRWCPWDDKDTTVNASPSGGGVWITEFELLMKIRGRDRELSTI
jgi:hypothetical protein